ncbi:molybdate ABC transporter substrate-binding protein [Georgenia alba]|uniref:Molybdate ABC transporter substrate-binding protein n=1 Tax=Georgenia alba TaxID=2233858 RepID=A0ABW2Q5Y4_9MICO
MRSRRLTGAVVAALLAGALGGCATGAEEPEGELTVFVAASLAEVADRVSQEARIEANVSAAGSSDLVSQVVSGAPADVLVTADEETMARAVEDGAVEEPEIVAANHPALVVPAGNPAGITGMDDLQDATLVVCAPQVPCGAAALELADLAGVELDPASEEPNVTDVLGTVTSGQADAAVVYTSDVVRARGEVEQVEVPEADQVTNAYPAAVVAGTDQPERARAWLDALTGDPGREALAEAGFDLP